MDSAVLHDSSRLIKLWSWLLSKEAEEAGGAPSHAQGIVVI